MKIFLPNPFVISKLFATVMLALVIGSYFFPASAFAQTAGTTSPYATLPKCPDNMPYDKATTCTYADNTQASCTKHDSGNTLAGVSQDTYTCVNADKSTSTCTDSVLVGSFGPTSGPQCSVKNANGAPAGSTSKITGPTGGTTSSTTDSSGKNTTTYSDGNGSSCGADIGCWLGKGLISILANVAYYMMSVVGYLLGLVGNVFNWVIVITVFQYAAYFANSSGMLIAWGILRDIANIVLLFGFIIMGLMIILDIQGNENRKALPRLIIVAVLLNFSLFASEAVVDVSNILSAALYKQAGTSLDASSCTSTTQSNTDNCNNVGIAGVILRDTYISTVWSGAKPQSGGSDVNQLLTYIGITLFMLVVLVLFLAAIVMFATRAIMLTILLVLSPLGFAGMAIPRLEGSAKQWQSRLISNAFFAPIFLLLMFIGLKVMDGARAALVVSGSTNTMADALGNPSQSAGGILLIFGLTIGFMVLALNYAKGSSAAGAKLATTFAQNTVRRASIMPFVAGAAAGGFVGRRTVGRGSAYLSDKISGSKFGRTEFGRFTKGITDKGAHASYDLRANKAVGAALGSQPGKTAMGGFHAIEEKAVTARTKHASTLHDSPKEKAKITALQESKRVAENAWNDKKNELNEKIKSAPTKAQKDVARATRDTAEKAHQIAMANLEKDMFNASAQGQYVKHLESGSNIPYKLKMEHVTLQHEADEKAANRIKRSSNKKDLDKVIDALKPAAPAGGGGGH